MKCSNDLPTGSYLESPILVFIPRKNGLQSTTMNLKFYLKSHNRGENVMLVIENMQCHLKSVLCMQIVLMVTDKGERVTLGIHSSLYSHFFFSPNFLPFKNNYHFLSTGLFLFR